MTNSCYSPGLHRLAVLTACVALLPILAGAVVTTKDGGMAFRDWPSSDGYNIFLYPWLKSAGAKFLEHGHRLALASAALACVACQCERRVWVRRSAYGVLAAVVLQGVMGGHRVLLDERGLAFLHGSFAALVLALMASVSVMTSRAWHSASIPRDRWPLARLGLLALVTCVCVFVQYLLGGLVRHNGTALHAHLGFAILAALVVVCFAMSAVATGIQWLRTPASLLAFLTIAQLALRAGAWVTKFGFDGYVATYGSLLQDVVRTSHVFCGMLLFVTTVVLAVRIARLLWLSRPHARNDRRLHAVEPSPTIESPVGLNDSCKQRVHGKSPCRKGEESRAADATCTNVRSVVLKIMIDFPCF
jgi:cytochrome c oxidase assembly protein subunit 15